MLSAFENFDLPDSLLRQVRNVVNLPDNEEKPGWLLAADETLEAMVERGEITEDVRQALRAILFDGSAHETNGHDEPSVTIQPDPEGFRLHLEEWGKYPICIGMSDLVYLARKYNTLIPDDVLERYQQRIESVAESIEGISSSEPPPPPDPDEIPF